MFRTPPDEPCGPPILLYNGYWVSIPVVKRPGRGVYHPPPSSAEVKERVELYLYSLSGIPWPVLGEIYLYLLHLTTEANATLVGHSRNYLFDGLHSTMNNTDYK